MALRCGCVATRVSAEQHSRNPTVLPTAEPDPLSGGYNAPHPGAVLRPQTLTGWGRNRWGHDMTDPRKTNAYVLARRAWLKTQPMVCHWCGRQVSDSHRAGHPAKATLDHLIEVDQARALALDPRLWVVACWGCNSARGATYGNGRGLDPNGIGEASRDW